MKEKKDDNPYAGIADASFTSWQYSDTKPLTVASVIAGMNAINEQAAYQDEVRAEYGRKYRAMTKAQRRRHDAEYQACCEIAGVEPDPVHPPMVHPKTYERIMARADEILKADQTSKP